MRKLLLAAIVVTGSAGAIAPRPSQAAPLAIQNELSPGGNIVLVDGGCGPAFFRAGNGLCYRKPGWGYPPPPPPPPPYYRPACPPGAHPTPWGCRWNY